MTPSLNVVQLAAPDSEHENNDSKQVSKIINVE